jgi:hypothetical protein
MSVDLSPVTKFFWDVDNRDLSWEKHPDFIIRRIFQSGDFHAARWLRAQMGDRALQKWLIQHNARGLSPRQIRYWSLILDIDSSLADQWVETAKESIWEKRG